VSQNKTYDVFVDALIPTVIPSILICLSPTFETQDFKVSAICASFAPLASVCGQRAVFEHEKALLAAHAFVWFE
jgi:hypothetical protein